VYNKYILTKRGRRMRINHTNKTIEVFGEEPPVYIKEIKSKRGFIWTIKAECWAEVIARIGAAK